MKYDEIRHAWNAQAEDGNGWYSLSEYEKVEWAASIGAATERAARQAAQVELAELKGRLARAGFDRCRAVLEEREACAKACEGMHEEDRPGDYAYAIRARGVK